MAKAFRKGKIRATPIYRGTMSEPYELGRLVYLPGRRVYGFYVKMVPKVLDQPGVLLLLLRAFSSRGVSIVHLKISRPEPGKPISTIMFADLTGKEELRAPLVKELESLESVEEARVIEPLFEGFVVDDVMFPPMLFGERVVILRRPGYEALVRGLRDKIGTGYEAILYHIGVELGRNYFDSHVRLVGRDLDKLTRICETLFRLVGYGILRYEEVDAAEKGGVARVWDSFECELYRGLGRPASHFVRGMIAGWLGKLFQADVKAVEVKCLATGDPYCEFRISEA